MFTGISGSMTSTTRKHERQAKDWFETKECAWWCDMAGTTHDHRVKIRELDNIIITLVR